MKKVVLKQLGYVCLGLGFVGAFLPILPTTPFVLLAAYCFSRSSEKNYEWLVSLPQFGAPIKSWNEEGVISVKGKVMCALSISLVTIYLHFFTATLMYIKWSVSVCLLIVVSFVLTRPSLSSKNENEN